MQLCFITGTDTDVGKTVVTSALLRALRKLGLETQAVKVIQTGEQTDAPVYATAVEDLKNRQILPPAQTLYSFPLAASPHLAAARAGQKLTVADLSQTIFKYCQKEGQIADLLLLEGAGGVHVPFNAEEDFLDLMSILACPVILVAPNSLGALNHIWLSLSAILNKGLQVAALVLVQTEQTDPAISEDNPQILKQKFRHKGWHIPIVSIPRRRMLLPADWQVLEQAVQPLASICATLHKTEHNKKATYKALLERDQRLLWHPYTSILHPTELYPVTRTYANRLVLSDGRELIDGMSSWWAAIHGYNHPHLLRAIAQQSAQMPHVMFGGLTHEPAIKLGERLLELLPQNLQFVFFADSGSVAVEVAMKMALQYQQGRKEFQRKFFLTPRGGYHGDTLGAMSVCDPVTGMHRLFSGYVPQQLFMDRPSCRFDSAFDPASLDSAKQILHAHGSELAAVILEPIVQGAGGMWFYHPDYLKGLAVLCQEAGCLLIVDEIATGFGRTGKFFASEWAGLKPDILCLGKALTGGVLTLAATVCTRQVAEFICQDGQAFMHGPTFMANALACAVANASLDLLAEHNWRKQISMLATRMQTGLEPCRTLPGVADVRVLGGIGVVETTQTVNMQALQRFFVREGVWLRPFNKLIYLMPPYITPREDVDKLCASLVRALQQKQHLNG